MEDDDKDSFYSNTMCRLTTPEVDKIMPALIKAQGEMESPRLTMTNPHYRNRYAPLGELYRVAKPPLNKHGMVLTQPVLFGESITRITHSSGQWVQAIVPIKTMKDDSQGFAGGLTYAKRQGCCSLLAMVGEDDDDGNAASGLPREPVKATPKREVWTGKIKRAVTISELRELEEGLKSGRSEIIGEHGSGTWARLRKAWGTRRDELAGDMLKAAAPWFADGGPFTVDVPLVSEVFEFLEQKIDAEDMAAHVIEKLGQGDNPHGKGLFASLTAEVLAHRAVDTVSSGSGVSS